MLTINEFPGQQAQPLSPTVSKPFSSIDREPTLGAEGGRSDNSAFSLYLREVSRTALLTPAEELELAARVKQGDEEAIEKMITANLRLVVKIAHQYEHYGVPLLDLISEGNIGLMKAVKRFDPAKGGRLSTYGVWWIKQSIKNALSNQSKTIRLPIHVFAKLSKMRRASTKLQEILGHEPSNEDLASELDMSASKVDELRKASITTLSLDAPMGDADGSSLGELVPDESSKTPFEQLEQEAAKTFLAEALETLSPREQEVIQHRFGLMGETRKTLEEVGDQFRVSRERVRQVEKIALSKLRKKFAHLEVEQVKLKDAISALFASFGRHQEAA